MVHDGAVIPANMKYGRFFAFLTFVIGVIYAVVTMIGLISLESPQDPIGDPWFTMMELLILLIAPSMMSAMAAVHGVSAQDKKLWSLLALVFMAMMAGLTSAVHFSILTVSPHLDHSQPWVQNLFLFEWPSVVYALDILAWDWFFALSMLFAVPVFNGDGFEKAVRYLFLISALLSFAGLLGVYTASMTIRNIGVLGYGVVAPIGFLFLGLFYNRLIQQSAL
ncbi:hypothetical protein DDZ15_08385 [Rhodohalobacter mucosus]|uniref:Uncharacterized protein n=2 Tax=Rhodohalobacter mucosus TaxID=2079485 RepID=A0A316TTU0_9BACT|nr:hypothetical protein DDZ15_08385 [Rhodohalobacter mucosus]